MIGVLDSEFWLFLGLCYEAWPGCCVGCLAWRPVFEVAFVGSWCFLGCLVDYG